MDGVSHIAMPENLFVSIPKEVALRQAQHDHRLGLHFLVNTKLCNFISIVIGSQSAKEPEIIAN